MFHFSSQLSHQISTKPRLCTQLHLSEVFFTTAVFLLQLTGLRDLMNCFLPAVWLHTLWTIQTDFTCTSLTAEDHLTGAHSCLVTCFKHSQILNRKPAAPINQIVSQSTLSTELSCAWSRWVMSLCAKKD